MDIAIVSFREDKEFMEVKTLIKAQTRDMIIKDNQALINSLFVDNTSYLNYLKAGNFSAPTIQRALNVGIGRLISQKGN